MSSLEFFNNPINGLVESLKARRRHHLNRRFGSTFEDILTKPEDEQNFLTDSEFLEKCGAAHGLKYAAAALKWVYPDARFEGPLRPDKYLFHSTSVRISWGVTINPFGYWSCNEVRFGAVLLDRGMIRFTRDVFSVTGDPSVGHLAANIPQGNRITSVAVDPNPEAINRQLAKAAQNPCSVAIYPPTLREVLTGRYARTVHHFLS